MIRLLDDNNVLDCILLMDKSTKDNDYPLERNERVWVEHLCSTINKQYESPHYLAIGDYDKTTNKLKGFMLASTFTSYYNGEFIMDVKDCIVDQDYNSAFTAVRLFDYMIEHLKKHKGTRWRADSVRSNTNAEDYVKFLQKKYNATPLYGVHGRIQ